MKTIRGSLVVSAMLGMLVLAGGCATAPVGAGGNPAPAHPALPTGEVIGMGTVMDVGGEVELCLAGVMESWPPQCSGVPLVGWDWSQAADSSESVGDVRWGAYAVQGTWDGTALTVTEHPISLAAYDPMPIENPTAISPVDEATLAEIQDRLPDRLGSDYLGSHSVDGQLWVQVVWDDGTWQDAFDAEFGAGAVLIQSGLRIVSE